MKKKLLMSVLYVICCLSSILARREEYYPIIIIIDQASYDLANRTCGKDMFENVYPRIDPTIQCIGLSCYPCFYHNHQCFGPMYLDYGYFSDGYRYNYTSGVRLNLTGKNRDVTLNKIKYLEKRKAKSENAKIEISKLKVTNAKFYKQYTTDSPAISTAEITLKNNSDYSIAMVFFKCMLITAKTGKTLIESEFTYCFPEVLGPGVENTYKIALNDFENWAKIRVSDTTKFKVSIIGLGTSTGIVYKNDFSVNEQDRLDALKKRI